MEALLSVVNHSNNSVNQMRNVMFLPYENIYRTNIYKEFCKNDRAVALFENSQYRLEINERLLGQKHRDILDIIFATAKLKPMTGERAYVDFTINSILAELNLTDGEENRKIIQRHLEELQKVKIKLIIKDGLFKDTILFNLCDKSAHSEKLNKYVLVFSDIYLAMFQRDILVDYKYYLPKLLKIESGVIKAFIRYIISNDWINHSLEELLSEIEIKKEDMSSRNFNLIKKQIRDSKELMEFGIEIDNKDQVRYRKLENVIFYNTAKEIKKYEQKQLDIK